MSQEFQTTKSEGEEKVLLLRREREQIRRKEPIIRKPLQRPAGDRQVLEIVKKIRPVSISHYIVGEEIKHLSPIRQSKAVRTAPVARAIEKPFIQPVQIEPPPITMGKTSLERQPFTKPAETPLPKLQGRILTTDTISPKPPKELIIKKPSSPQFKEPPITELREEPIPSIKPEKPKTEKLPELPAEVKVEVEEIPSGIGTGVGVIPSFYELFLEYFHGEGERAFSSGKPRILILGHSGDKFDEAIRIICSQLYQENPGGQPGIEFATTKEGKRRIEATSGLRLVYIDESQDEYFVAGGEERWKALCDRVNEFASIGATGFLIFNVKEGEVEDFYYKLKGGFPSNPEVYSLGLKNLSKKLKEETASLAWGLVEMIDIADVREEKGTPKLESFDDFFSRGKKRFETCLEGILKEKNSLYYWATNPSLTDESALHFQLKAFVVRYYAQERRLEEKEKIKEQIQTETTPHGDHVIDIYLPDEKLAIEAETLFGVGIDKLRTTLAHYEKQAVPVRIILSNLTLLRHLKELKELKEKYYRELDLGFWTLNLKKGAPISLEEVEMKVTQLASLDKKQRN
ncbi:hypothetical protein M1O13_03625 [Dehalococcoidia bacterium]|nr:hypothetical protein [Dehalococcoidia bacterium]MCL0103937.1 hypothetical protein [Dehalococcoidia bacterium]